MLPRFAARLAALFVFTCTAAFAQNTIHVPTDQHSIQAGINAANNGDTVLVAPGTYLENIDFKGKAITVTSSGGASVTIIDANASGNVVQFVSGETRAAVLDGFTIQNSGKQPDAFSNPFGYGGGGVMVYKSAPTLNALIVRNNLCNGIWAEASAPLIQNSTISDTVAFTSNASQSDMYTCTFGNGTGVVFHNPFVNAAGASLQPTVLNSVMTRNNGTSVHSSIMRGGGVASLDAEPLIQGNLIYGNSAPGYNAVGLGGGIDIWDGGATIVQNVIYGNSAEAGGGGLSITQPIGMDQSPVYVINNTIADNTITLATPDDGIGYGTQVYLLESRKTVFVNNTITGSTANAIFDCGMNFSTSPQPYLILDSNNVFNAAGAALSPYCPTSLGSLGYNNISASPLFAAPSSGNYQLAANSPLIDVGNNSAPFLSATDFLGNPRFQDATHKGYNVVDIGAYEFTGALTTPATMLTLDTFPRYVPANQPYTLIARLASAQGVPIGDVVFYDGGTVIGTSHSNAGVATFTTAPLTQGAHLIYATYAGVAPFAPANAVEEWLIVYGGGSLTTISLTSFQNPSSINQSVTFTATLTSANGTPTGSITFTDGATTLGTQLLDTSGVATFSTSTLTVGTHPITATYFPTNSFAPGSANISQIVTGTATSTTLTSSLNPSTTGQNTNFTSTVTSTNGTPTGSIQFTDNGTVLGTQTLDATGLATLSTSTLAVGSHTITATYIPTGAFAGSSTTITQTVNDVTFAINITSSLNPSNYGQPVTFTLHTAPSGGVVVPGSVTFSDGGQFLSRQTVDASGDGSITLSTLSVGAHIITGAYTPDSSPHTFGISLTQQVNGLPATTLLTATPLTGVAHITPITLTATVAAVTPGGPTLTGQVIFYVNGAQFNLATLVNGVATFTGILPAGASQIYVAYTGDPSHIYNSSNSNTLTVTITAAPSTLSVTSSLNPAPALTPFTLSAQLGIPGGTQPGAGYPIAFTIAPATSAQAATNAAGTAAYTSAGLLPGQYLVTATFAGTSDLQPSTATSFIETVIANPTATTLTASPNPGIQNNPVTFTSTVSALTGAASPAGTVTIYDSLSPNPAFTPIATLTVPSPATFTTNALAPGTHILYEAFTPAVGFAASQSAQITLVIEPQSFTLTLSEPSLSLQTGHHHTETASLTSIGGLTGSFTLSCGTLPQYASCGWSQGSVTLPANGTVSTSLTIDTDQLLRFVASNTRPDQNPGGPSMPRSLRHEWGTTAAFTLLPLTLLGFRRRKLLSLLPLLILATLATTLTACGASQYPYSTTPGTYTVLVTAAGPPVPGGVSPTQTAVLTLHVLAQ